MKKNWIIIIILFLLAANAALVSTLIISNKNTPQENTENRREFNRKHYGQGQGHFERHLDQNLNLSEEQIQQISMFRSDFQQKKRELILESKNLSKNYYQQLSAPKPDSNSIEDVSRKLGNIHTQMMMLDFNHYRNIRSVCTPEQARKLDSLGKSRYEHFNKRREDPNMQWRPKHSGESQTNRNKRNVKNHENKE